MQADRLATRFSLIPYDGPAGRAPLELRREGALVVLVTGAYYVRRARGIARAAAGFALLAGLVLPAYSAWGAALALAGALALAAVPSRIRALPLVEIDTERETVISAAGGYAVPVRRITRFRGTYEIHGWDARSAIYALLEDGSEYSVLVFPGTDEALAEFGCRTLGCLLDRRATYSGPFGGVKECYLPKPAASENGRMGGASRAAMTAGALESTPCETCPEDRRNR